MAVYLIQAGGLPIVKIGKANCPVTRLAQHQTGHWETLKIIRLWVGDHAEESMLHRRFSDLHIRGEWFSFSKAMLGDVGLVEITDLNPPPEPVVASVADFLAKFTPEQQVRFSEVKTSDTASTILRRASARVQARKADPADSHERSELREKMDELAGLLCVNFDHIDGPTP